MPKKKSTKKGAKKGTKKKDAGGGMFLPSFPRFRNKLEWYVDLLHVQPEQDLFVWLHSFDRR
eukprot:m.58315 g.58315  ORF g.58315 m.58315 type:complete len:62 (+) comp11679_c0_seq5:134-319(+)